MIDLSFSQISKYNRVRHSSKGYKSLQGLIDRLFKKCSIRHDSYDIHHGNLVLTGDAALRQNKRFYFTEEDCCQRCGKPLVYKPYDLDSMNDCCCFTCLREMEKDLHSKNVVAFSSFNGRLDYFYSKKDLVTYKIEDMPDRTRAILDFLRETV